ncbi:hypothetical protein VLK31_07145 [Variovorax sp. H27-G14]|uniref:hypothetical protein n=1 Tax=Variovorax sp. H27-G14 TaxID=3111914 RepID=UPI0038FC7D49
MPTRPVAIGTFTGVNNRLEQSQLESQPARGVKLQALPAGVNIDLNDKGGVRRRRGQTPRAAGIAHSVWGDGHDDGYAVIGTDLVRLTPSGPGLQAEVMRAGVSAGRPTSFERFPDGAVYYANGEVMGRIRDGVDGPVVTEALGSLPVFTVIAGSLAAGRYTVVLTAVGTDGESAATAPVQIEVPANGGIRLANLPGDLVRAYMTGPNGEIPTLELETTATSVDLVTHAASGIRCQTLLLASMPAGELVRHYNGRLLTVVGNLLIRSEPYYYGVFDASKGYIPFPAPITIVQPAVGGVYVVADQTYWLAGDLDNTSAPPILPYGAVRGTGGYDATSETVFWLSDRGLVIADGAGSAKNVQEDALALAGGTRGAALYREQNGSRHIVTSRSGAEPARGVSRGWKAAEIIRKDIDQ